MFVSWQEPGTVRLLFRASSSSTLQHHTLHNRARAQVLPVTDARVLPVTDAATYSTLQHRPFNTQRAAGLLTQPTYTVQ